MKLGIDLGSRQVKLAWQNLAAPPQYLSWPTPYFYRQYMHLEPNGGTRLALERLGLHPTPEHIAATGYGRHNVQAEHVVLLSEIEAHAYGASQEHTGSFLLLDFGGQDTKVVLVSDSLVEDFVVNDKCAAGSGRYLENMAQVLGVDLTFLFQQSEDPVDLTTTCATYAESEIISKIADGVPLTRLCAGVNHSTFLRLLPMLERWNEKRLVVVGGGARNTALIQYLRTAGYQVDIPLHPEFNGARGCLSRL